MSDFLTFFFNRSEQHNEYRLLELICKTRYIHIDYPMMYCTLFIYVFIFESM